MAQRGAVVHVSVAFVSPYVQGYHPVVIDHRLVEQIVPGRTICLLVCSFASSTTLCDAYLHTAGLQVERKERCVSILPG